MNNFSIKGYKRISQKSAEKLYNMGETIRICAENLSPVNIYGMFVDINNRHYTNVASDGFNSTVARSREFEDVVFAFTYYNCNRETGVRPAFYVKGV